MSRRIAPPPRIILFEMECFYLREMVSFHYLNETVPSDYFARWQICRPHLVKYLDWYKDAYRHIPEALKFCDALISDWQAMLAGETSYAPIDDKRINQLRLHIAHLAEFDDGRYEVKY